MIGARDFISLKLNAFKVKEVGETKRQLTAND